MKQSVDAAYSERIIWIDAVKGFAIALVVLGHVLGGVLLRNWMDPSGPGRHLYDLIYAFHMPLFFLVSGYFLGTAARERPLETAATRFGTIAWPYFLWEAIRFASLPFIAVYMAHSPSATFPEWLLNALTGRLGWFLWTLFIVQIAFIIFARLPLQFMLAGAIVAHLLINPLEHPALQRAISMMPFLIAGAMLNPEIERWLSRTPAKPLVAVIAFAILSASIATSIQMFPLGWIICASIGCAAAIMLIYALPYRVNAVYLAPLGQASLAIYLLHPYFQGAAREITLRLIGPSPAAQVIITVVVAVLGPFAVWLLAEKLGARWLFRLDLARARK